MELKCLLYSNGNNQKSAQTSRNMRDNLYKAAFLRLVKTIREASESLDKQRLICQCMRCPEMTKDFWLATSVHKSSLHPRPMLMFIEPQSCWSDLSLIQRGLGEKKSQQRASWLSFKEKWHSVVTIKKVVERTRKRNHCYKIFLLNNWKKLNETPAVYKSKFPYGHITCTNKLLEAEP